MDHLPVRRPWLDHQLCARQITRGCPSFPWFDQRTLLVSRGDANARIHFVQPFQLASRCQSRFAVVLQFLIKSSLDDITDEHVTAQVKHVFLIVLSMRLCVHAVDIPWRNHQSTSEGIRKRGWGGNRRKWMWDMWPELYDEVSASGVTAEDDIRWRDALVQGSVGE